METRSALRANVDINGYISVDTDIDQKVSLARGTRFQAHFRSVSILGMGIVCYQMLPRGLKVRMEIEGKYFALPGVMSIKGEIRYCRQIMLSQYNCGVKFIDFPKDYKDKIHDYVAVHGHKRKTG